MLEVFSLGNSMLVVACGAEFQPQKLVSEITINGTQQNNWSAFHLPPTHPESGTKKEKSIVEYKHLLSQKRQERDVRTEFQDTF